MKVQCVLPVTLIVSVAMVAIMHIRKTEFNYEERKNKFVDIKLRMTSDVLQDRQSEAPETKALLEKTQGEHKALEEKVNMLQAKADEETGKSDVCLGGQKSATDELASAETELQNLKAEYDKETTNWKNELEALKRQQTERSAVCGFLKPGSHLASCGNEEAPKPEEPKPEAPKPGEPKPGAPKPDEPKPEAPKPEKPKPKDPEPEETKPEAPKPGEPKAEAPKPEKPKPKDPEPEETKPEDPEPEETKPEAPEPEETKPEDPEPEKIKPEDPEPEETKPEAPEP
ncbi:anti-sigma-I factor RsgI8-like [Pseudoliparis swirei]|uniref:anti-sigma-I factor RsgI8-like n=1 Tax=Pseudoliparis swirei TaxID=2059687 RepID=UPI0024BEDB52|nr:anti-sigma-I factor RsgI8-like [Pseudoliparis swirei]